MPKHTISDIIHKRDKAKQYAVVLDTLAAACVNNKQVGDAFKKVMPREAFEELTGAASMLRDYSDTMARIIDTTEISWPPRVDVVS